MYAWRLMAVFRHMVDGLVRRMRPGWIRLAVDSALSPYERFSPPRRMALPDGQRLCVVAPHPDDESIACGGLLALWVAAGRQADVVFLTGGEMGSAAVRGMAAADPARVGLMADLRGVRRAEAVAALGILGAQGTWFDGADGALQGDEARLVAQLAALWQAAPPDVIAAPYPADRHADHAVAARIVGRALRGDVRVWGYEVWSPAPINAVLDISTVADVKWRAIAAHASQVRETDYVRAAQGLNAYRAISAGQKLGFAEGYHVAHGADYARMANSLKV
jgi:LmbE family N-acetylglucosaminyl deacetylase